MNCASKTIAAEAEAECKRQFNDCSAIAMGMVSTTTTAITPTTTSERSEISQTCTKKVVNLNVI